MGDLLLFGWTDDSFRPQIQCRSKGGLCVHTTFGLNTGEAWSVSHQETGLMIACFRVEMNAYAFAEKVAKVTDWKAVQDKKLPPQIVEAIRDIGAEFADCHIG